MPAEPYKPEHEKRTARVTITLTETERDELQVMADEFDLTLSGYIRSVVTMPGVHQEFVRQAVERYSSALVKLGED